jgi:hypothetical protein
VKIDGMGHDMPPALWQRCGDEIVANAERARAGAGATST